MNIYDCVRIYIVVFFIHAGSETRNLGFKRHKIQPKYGTLPEVSIRCSIQNSTVFTCLQPAMVQPISSAQMDSASTRLSGVTGSRTVPMEVMNRLIVRQVNICIDSCGNKIGFEYNIQNIEIKGSRRVQLKI